MQISYTLGMAKAGRKKGSIPWNKGLKTGLVPKTAFKKGHIPWSKGKKTGIVPKTAFRKGQKKSANWYKAVVGRVPWNKGIDTRPGCNECGEKLSSHRGKVCLLCYRNGKTGKSTNYRAIHQWIALRKGEPDTCSNCGKNGFKGREIHWANIDHKYSRNLDDWIRLCKDCHWEYDKGMKLKKGSF